VCNERSTLLPSLIDPATVHRLEWATLAFVTLVTLAMIDLSWIFLAHRARKCLQTPKAARIANRCSALGLGGAATVIAVKD